METPPDERRSLTARLASAAADSGYPQREDNIKPAAVDEDRPRCTSSVVSGQRCPRPAAPDSELCAGHVAMGGSATVKMRAAR